jgi:hypothetical protein
MIVVVLVLATAPLVAGCGAGGTASMDEKFQKLEYEIANLETVNSSYNMRDFLRETQKYIALVRQYADQLGPAEARKRLMQEGDELSTYCLPCQAALSSEALKY